MVDSEPVEPQWRSLHGESLTSRIRHEILRFLESESLQPGDRLPSERQLAVVLGVSRPSVREATKALQSEGKLTVRHGQGVFVADPATTIQLRRSLLHQSHDLSELFAMREVLEVPAARWAAELGDASALEKVQQAHDELLSASRRTPVDLIELQRLDMAFHLSIVHASGNRFLEQTQGVLNSILAEGMETTLGVPGRLSRSREDHASILRGIMDGDAQAAADAARNHVRGAARAAGYALNRKLGDETRSAARGHDQ